MSEMGNSEPIGSSAPGGQKKGEVISLDQLGIWTSALCVVHCVLTPVLLSISAVWVHFLPSEERTHRMLAVIIATLGALALVKGYRNHRRLRVLLLMVVGLSCIFASAYWGNTLPSHRIEVLITFIGSGFMITAHRMNHTFCRECRCAHPD
jgi:MerC mercury resistance protein